jgi:MFS transporter, SP family, xylose:H+ symportor
MQGQSICSGSTRGSDGRPPLPESPSVTPQHSLYIWGIALVAALGGLLFGYDWVVIGGARQFYEVYVHLTSALVGWANSCALVGRLFGSLAAAGTLADRYGHRRILLAAAVLFAVCSVLTGWAWSFSAFIFWRIIGGTAIGLSSNVSPLYIAEISPAADRGRLVSLNQFAIVVGTLLAQIVNWRLARPVPSGLPHDLLLQTWNIQYGWRWMFTAVTAPALVFALASLFITESPRWLCGVGRAREARAILERIGGSAYAGAEIAGIESAQRPDAALMQSSWNELLLPEFRKILLVGIALAALQQWTGINILFNYAERSIAAPATEPTIYSSTSFHRWRYQPRF